MNKLLLILSSIALLAGCARHRESGTGGTAGIGTGRETAAASTELSATDAKFARDTAQAGIAEVQTGRLMTQNSQSQAMKDFGQRLIDDHSKANNELTQIASAKRLTIPSQPSDEQQKVLNQLGGLKGTEFDRVAQTHAVQEHEKAIQMFEKAAQTGQDAELKAFAQKHLPMLREHLNLAKGLEPGKPVGTEGQTAPEQK